jgi:hypothetical protein
VLRLFINGSHDVLSVTENLQRLESTPDIPTVVGPKQCSPYTVQEIGVFPHAENHAYPRRDSEKNPLGSFYAIQCLLTKAVTPVMS